MIVASFLVKDLLIPWQQGAAWFWNALVDADLHPVATMTGPARLLAAARMGSTRLIDNLAV